MREVMNQEKIDSIKGTEVIMKGVNVKYNYRQSATECRDKLVGLCNRWEMDDSDKDYMKLEIDDDFMSTIYSVVRILSKTDMREEELKEMIVDLRMNNVKANIPRGNCPYAYYHKENPIEDCNSVSCEKCEEIFFDEMRKDIEEEVAQL